MKLSVGKNRAKQITIIGDADASADAFKFAEQISAALAKLGFTIITGGGVGIMEAANKGAFEAGGLSIGILPSASLSDANPYCTVVLPTGLGHARNAVTALSCDAVVSLGGGAGTLSEICFGWIYNKPIFVFEQFDGWSQKVSGQQLDRNYFSRIEKCDSIEDLIKKLDLLFGN